MTARPPLGGADTGGALSVAVLDLAGGEGTGATQALDVDAVFYVLDGELTFAVGEDLVTAGANTVVLAPSGTPHAVASPAGAEGRCVRLCAPAAEPAAIGPTDLDAGAGRRAAPVPRGINVVVRGAHTGGRIAVMDNAAAPDFVGPPLHHHDFDELFFVLEGEMTYQLGEEIVRRRAGELAFAPRGAHHTWANHSGAPGRQLIVCTPAGLEPYFARMAAERAGVEPPAWAFDPVPETTVVGPQIR